jgi:Ca-activated chloride channel family protein
MSKKISKLHRVVILITLLAPLFLTSFSPQRQTGQGEEIVRITQVDTSQFPQVTVYVAVVDEDSQPVGVNPSRLVIEENDVPIPLDQIQGVGEVGPLTTMLVMDVSGSMHVDGKLEAAKAAATAYVDQMRPGDQVGLVTFSTEIKYVQAVTSDRREMVNAINALIGIGDTAMYDALIQAVDILEPMAGRKAIIALTDGLDNQSASVPEDVLERIGPSGLSISTIGLGDPEHGPGAVTALDEDALMYLAENAGGLYGYANDEASLSNLYQNYAIGLQSEYVLTYTSPSALRDGVNRALSVSLSNLSGTIGVNGERVVYNPGGLVPEVSEPASWPLFFSLLAGLVVLLLLPWVINRVAALTQGSGGGRRRLGKKRSRIKLKD